MSTIGENVTRRDDPEAADSGQSDATRGPVKATPTTRLPGIDIIRVSLTWGILLFHTTVAYCSVCGGWYISAQSLSSDNVLYYLPAGWVGFMDVWQMPMFFFLSGVSAFHALNRRSEREFRKERVHRLLVPWLLLVLTNGVYSVTFVAPHSPWSTTFSEFLMSKYLIPSAGQGWFLLYLFIYSQVNKTWITFLHSTLTILYNQ